MAPPPTFGAVDAVAEATAGRTCTWIGTMSSSTSPTWKELVRIQTGYIRNASKYKFGDGNEDLEGAQIIATSVSLKTLATVVGKMNMLSDTLGLCESRKTLVVDANDNVSCSPIWLKMHVGNTEFKEKNKKKVAANKEKEEMEVEPRCSSMGAEPERADSSYSAGLHLWGLFIGDGTTDTAGLRLWQPTTAGVW